LASEDEPKPQGAGQSEAGDAAATQPTAPAPAPDAAAAATGESAGGGAAAGDQGGWVIEIRAHHYHNKQGDSDIAKEYVRKTLLRELKEKKDLQFLDTQDVKPVPISIKDLGIDLPVIVTTSIAPVEEILTDQKLQEILSASAAAAPGPSAQPTIPGTTRPISEHVRKYDFTVQFIWKPTPLYLREAHRREERNKAKAAEADQTPKVAERTSG
jgi:hypothetical protein